jgi:DNA mismatch endonuclease, patch repair protein
MKGKVTSTGLVMGLVSGRKYPSFSGLLASNQGSSKAKRANRSSNTIHELELRAAIRKLGLRCRICPATILGRPDLVFPHARVAVFCDGDFWHGRNWVKLERRLQNRANAAYWVAKIAANRQRDFQVNRALRRAGWCVLRFWEGDVRADPGKAARKIAERVRGRTKNEGRGYPRPCSKVTAGLQHRKARPR